MFTWRYTMVWYVYICTLQHSLERTMCFLPWWLLQQATSPQGGRTQLWHDDTANLVSQFIIEEISLTMRKSLKMEAKSYLEEEQQLSQLSLPFDFKIQCNITCHWKSQHQFLIIKEDTENTHHLLMIMAKDATIPF